MENKLGLKTIVVVVLLMLGLGVPQHAQADCSYSQLQCIQICEADDTPHDTCVRDCGCNSLILHSQSPGLGLQQHAKVGDCSYSQLQCIEVCQADDTPHDTCVRDCGCNSLISHSESAGLGLQQHTKVGDCSYSQLQCIQVCEADDTPHDTCVRDCGCASVGLLHSQSDVSAGHDHRCRLGCSSKCNGARKFGSSEYLKKWCNEVCYGLCAKGVEVTTATA